MNALAPSHASIPRLAALPRDTPLQKLFATFTEDVVSTLKKQPHDIGQVIATIDALEEAALKAERALRLAKK